MHGTLMTLSLTFFAASLVVAILYLIRRIGLYITPSSLLLIGLIGLHGPAYLLYCWSYGPNSIFFHKIVANVKSDDIIATLNFALGLTFLGVVIGMEAISRLFPAQTRFTKAVLKNWSTLPVKRDYQMTVQGTRICIVILLGMMLVSISDHQISKLAAYLATQGGEFDKIALRNKLGGSNNYFYNLVMYSLAPFMVVCLFNIWKASNDKKALLLGLILFAVVLLGKLATLSKAPAVIFVFQILLANFLFKTIKVSAATLLKITFFALTFFSAVTLLAIPEIGLSELRRFLYNRIFMVTNEVLLEYFAAIPSKIDHSWGMQIGVIKSLVQSLSSTREDLMPTYTAVAAIARDGSTASTSTAMFMADAWAEFSWFGVIGFSIFFGALVRMIDFYALRHGKSGNAIAIIVGTAFGIYTALNTALTTALLSGGLLVIPFLSLLFFKVPSRARRPINA
jgi:hypothetical protein